MGKGGKYLNKKAPAAKKHKKGKKSVFRTILIVLLVLVVLLIGVGVWYYNYLLNMISRPDDMVASPSVNTVATEATVPAETEEATVGTTSPEETWPEIVSDENITNIMLVGQAARDGETHLISDTMILVSINRENKTLTLTSLMRDMCLVWPKYVDTLGKPHTGNNRINMAYNMGYHWTGNKQDSMDLLESIVQHNFGVPVDRTVEIGFEVFENVINTLGGAEVDITAEELAYLQDNYGWMDKLVVGTNNLDGYQALCYARMRKVGHGDYERTERQREVITSLLNKLKDMNILEIHKLFTEILPMITTDMTNKEITNYAFEFIPMLKDLQIQSQRIPFEGNEVSVVRDGDYMIAPRDLNATAKQLQESIGMTTAKE